jgi:hypothetical protein
VQQIGISLRDNEPGRSPVPSAISLSDEGVARQIVWRQHTDCAGGSNGQVHSRRDAHGEPRSHVDGNLPMRFEPLRPTAK